MAEVVVLPVAAGPTVRAAAEAADTPRTPGHSPPALGPERAVGALRVVLRGRFRIGDPWRRVGFGVASSAEGGGRTL